MASNHSRHDCALGSLETNVTLPRLPPHQQGTMHIIPRITSPTTSTRETAWQQSVSSSTCAHPALAGTWCPRVWQGTREHPTIGVEAANLPSHCQQARSRLCSWHVQCNCSSACTLVSLPCQLSCRSLLLLCRCSKLMSIVWLRAEHAKHE